MCESATFDFPAHSIQGNNMNFVESSFNSENARKLADWIQKETVDLQLDANSNWTFSKKRYAFNMADYITVIRDSESQKNYCGTAACIAGSCVLMQSFETINDVPAFEAINVQSVNAEEIATDYLGITQNVANELFSPQWFEFADKVISIANIRKKHAIHVLRNLAGKQDNGEFIDETMVQHCWDIAFRDLGE